MGGAFSTKKHITKADKIKAMGKKYSTLAKQATLKNIDVEISELEDQLVPPPLLTMTAPIVTRLNDLRSKSGNDETIIEPLLETLSDHQLECLKSVLDGTKTAVKPEVKMEQIAYQLTTDFQALDDYINHLYKMKADALEFFIQVYAKEYNQERSGALSFDHGKLLSEVNGLVNYRKGIRMMTAANDGGDEPPAREGSCCIS